MRLPARIVSALRPEPLYPVIIRPIVTIGPGPVQDSERSHGIRADLPARIRDLRRGNPSAPAQRRAPARGPLPRREPYLIAIDQDAVVGMIALRGERPFRWTRSSATSILPARRVGESASSGCWRSGRTHRRGDGVPRPRRSASSRTVARGASTWPSFPAPCGRRSCTGTWDSCHSGPRSALNDAPFQPMYMTFEDFQARRRPIVFAGGGAVSFLPGSRAALARTSARRSSGRRCITATPSSRRSSAGPRSGCAG